MRSYASQIIKEIDSDGKIFKGLYCREDCKELVMETVAGPTLTYHKIIEEKIKYDDYRRFMLVDDSILAKMRYPRNCFHI